MSVSYWTIVSSVIVFLLYIVSYFMYPLSTVRSFLANFLLSSQYGMQAASTEKFRQQRGLGAGTLTGSSEELQLRAAAIHGGWPRLTVTTAEICVQGRAALVSFFFKSLRK